MSLNWLLLENTRVGRSTTGATFCSHMRAGSHCAQMTWKTSFNCHSNTPQPSSSVLSLHCVVQDLKRFSKYSFHRPTISPSWEPWWFARISSGFVCNGYDGYEHFLYKIICTTQRTQLLRSGSDRVMIDCSVSMLAMYLSFSSNNSTS